jgi:hypothetical protein
MSAVRRLAATGKYSPSAQRGRPTQIDETGPESEASVARSEELGNQSHKHEQGRFRALRCARDAVALRTSRLRPQGVMASDSRVVRRFRWSVLGSDRLRSAV